MYVTTDLQNANFFEKFRTKRWEENHMLCYENQEKRVLEKREINSVEYHRGAKTGRAGKKHFCLVIKKPGLLFNEQYELYGQYKNCLVVCIGEN